MVSSVFLNFSHCPNVTLYWQSFGLSRHLLFNLTHPYKKNTCLITSASWGGDTRVRITYLGHAFKASFSYDDFVSLMLTIKDLSHYNRCYHWGIMCQWYVTYYTTTFWDELPITFFNLESCEVAIFIIKKVTNCTMRKSQKVKMNIKNINNSHMELRTKKIIKDPFNILGLSGIQC